MRYERHITLSNVSFTGMLTTIILLGEAQKNFKESKTIKNIIYKNQFPNVSV